MMQREIGEPLSIPTSVFKDLYKHPLVEQADLIHLHSVTGFIDYPTFFKKVDKPIVWTLHDENLLNGLAHFSRTVVPNKAIDRKYYNIKLAALKDAKNLGIVFLSDMMYDKYHEQDIVKGHQTTVINNPVDTSLFIPQDRRLARKALGLAEDAVVLIFVAALITDPWKGLDALSRAIKMLNMPNVQVLAVGKKDENLEYPSFIKAIGPIYDAGKLSQAYSAADYFVSASTQEAFAQTPIEAMACGIPAVLTPVSGTSELITEQNGVRCKGFSPKDIAEGLRTAFERKYDSCAIREDVKHRFSTVGIAKKYLEFYKRIINDKL